MSKFDIGVGEAFPLDESQQQERCRHRHRHPHSHDFTGHHHRDRAAMALLFALKAFRRHVRASTEPQQG
jgi:hypothetical protein